MDDSCVGADIIGICRNAKNVPVRYKCARCGKVYDTRAEALAHVAVRHGPR